MGELRDEPRRVDVTSHEVVFRGRVWDVARDAFVFGDGTLVRDYVDHPGAVAILALDDRQRVAVIRQYRHPVRRTMLEIPAGLLDVAGEPPVECGRRELAEEADLAADSWEHLLTFSTSPGGSSEFLHVYLATGLRPIASGYVRGEEEAEFVLEWVPLADLVRAILDDRLGNPSLVVAVLALWARMHPPARG